MRKLCESKSDKINEREREPEMGREDDRERERERKGDGRTPLQQVGRSMLSSTAGRHSSRLDC